MRLLTLASVFGLLFVEQICAQGTLLDLRQDDTAYNLGSTNGLPISLLRGNPPGSDGRGPTPARQQEAGLTIEPANRKQFRGLVVFGGVVRPGTTRTNLVTNSSYFRNAVILDLPRDQDRPQGTSLYMTAAQVGAPFLSRSVSFLFGQEIPVPDTDELGVLLGTTNLATIPPRDPQPPERYWRAEPYTDDGHTNAPYYFSRHAQRVFAVKPGPIQIRWQRNDPYDPAVTTNNVTVVTNSFGTVYVVATKDYVVASSPVKPARLMYWTEKAFADTGKPITVPAALVGDVHVVYDGSRFPERMAEVVIPGVLPIFTNTVVSETRTLWYDKTGGSSGQIRAYNAEGRVFMELLGDLRQNGNREHLGFEIVDVSRRPSPHDVRIELGEKLTAFPGGSPADDDLFPEPLGMQSGQEFAYQHLPGGGARTDFYATRETLNQNDLLVHWMQEGEQGLKWPFRFVRYQLDWPGDVAKYSHYVRPKVLTEEEAQATAVPLPTENGPAIAYQDPLDQPRGKLTESFAYYSWLTPEHPAHRALLRFTAGGQVRFERVFSWLDEGLRHLPWGFASDFTQLRAGARTVGDAVVKDGVLHLDDGTDRNSGDFVLEEFDGEEPVRSFRARFQVSLGGSPLSGGFGFNFGSASEPALDGDAETLSVRFLPVTPATLSVIEIRRGGVLVASRRFVLDLINRFVPVEIALDETGAMDVSYDGRSVFSQISTGYSPRNGQFSFTSFAERLNAWQVADSFTGNSFLYYTNALTSVQRSAATNHGWRLAVVSRLVEGSPNSNPAQSLTYGDGVRRFTIGWDTNSAGSLIARRTLTNGSIELVTLPISRQAAADYHTHELIYDPATRSVAYQVNGNPVFGGWEGVADTNFNGQVAWGANSSAGRGRMNYHQVRLDIETLGMVAEYHGGTSENPVRVPDPVEQGWGAVRSTPSNSNVFAAAARTPEIRIDDLSITVNRGEASPNAVSFDSSVAATLDSWSTNGFGWPDPAVRPRITSATVTVGQRIEAPEGEIGGVGSSAGYLAGHVRLPAGTSFLPEAYLDPFRAAGFTAANRGAIIPVNAIPGQNQLEVWWFRRNRMAPSEVFQEVLWPSVIGRYTLQWPTDAPEIVLASDDGSGALPSLQAKGRIYVQNDRNQAGFNPNEEHALMQGGQAYALRDDLNITTTNNNDYSSEPFVLLAYTGSDGRPSMRPFRVLREKPEAGIVFDYRREAGLILQPPMPLPLMEKPLAPNIPGQPPNSLNTEIAGYTVASSTRSGVNTLVSTSSRHFIKPFEVVALQHTTNNPSATSWLLPTMVGPSNLTGLVTPVQPMDLKPHAADQPANSRRWRFGGRPSAGLINDSRGTLFRIRDGTNAGQWTVTVVASDPASRFVEVDFNGVVPEVAKAATILVAAAESPAANQFKDYRLAPEPLPAAITDQKLRDFYGQFTLKDRKGSTWIYRGPHDPETPPSLVMQFYYKTLPDFFFPSLPIDDQPPVGTITPYLRPRGSGGRFEGDPVYGNRVGTNQVADGNALGITYRPVWPSDAPTLLMAETLTTPRRGLSAVRGQTSLEILYQQSQAARGLDGESVVLHDPTREKEFALGARDNGTVLDQIPPSVRTSLYQGKTYFPDLPPHLVDRFHFDPNRGDHGHLVFQGTFVDAALGDAYVFLNTLSASDAGALKDLCDSEDTKRTDWEEAIDGLKTTLETFIEDPAKPRTYIPSDPQEIGAGELARIGNDDVAVDSYALTATGPGTGFVSLIAGNGRAFTPEGDPVSVEILRVVDTLYRGEVNIVESSNPLNEKLVLQQVVDLAGRAQDYQFEWKIAAPVDGLPPRVYENTPTPLLSESDGNWLNLRFPLPSDTAASAPGAGESRYFPDGSSHVIPVSSIPYQDVVQQEDRWVFTISEGSPHGLRAGNRVTLHRTDGPEVFGTVHGLTTPTQLHVALDPDQQITIATHEIQSLSERILDGGIQSIVFRQFTVPAGVYSEYWLSLDLDDALGATVYHNGQPAVRINTGVNDTATARAPQGLDSLRKAYRLNPALLAGGVVGANGARTHIVALELRSGARPNASLVCNVRLGAMQSVDKTEEQWLPLDITRYPDGVRALLGGAGDVQSLGDNYLIMRYQPTNSAHASYVPDENGSNAVWSQWTDPQLAEGWIKRVLKGINPFNQRITDLFNNAVDTDVSLVSQAGQRWEGNVALNLDALNDAGLIEIYETVLGRGKDLSINSGINYGPANDALLLAAGYLNDLYMVLGNEAWADASNPTIGIGTKDSTYGDIATSLFSFRGQLPTLLEEELALLRGRDDFLLPGVELRPVYNRLIWNYTRGIDAGEVVYALNYNILDQNTDGRTDADDARRLYPQGHGDAYGHYLTALKGYYKLLLDPNFSWVPRIEAVTVLGKPVSVDYQDERKFAAAAAAVARTGRQIFDLTWRRDYQSGDGRGWSHFADTRENNTRPSGQSKRAWGMDHWATRTGNGAYLHWVVGNAMLPHKDPDPSHAGSIQQVDRTTVPELKELAILERGLQTALDNAEAGLTPVGLPENAIPFDLNPLSIANGPFTHFEQIYQRAKDALNNAVVSFDDAKDVTRLMRSEEDSLAELRTTVAQQELAYTNALIELYGTPYPDDIGPGRTYRTGFNGPDTIHYMYVDTKELTFAGPQGTLLNPEEDKVWKIDTQTFTANWANQDLLSTFNFIQPAFDGPIDGTGQTPGYETTHYLEYNLSSHGFFKKPAHWTGRRAAPGRIQQAISDIAKARNAAFEAFYWADAAKYDLDWAIRSLEERKESQSKIREKQKGMLEAQQVADTARLATETIVEFNDSLAELVSGLAAAGAEAIPESAHVDGGDVASAVRGGILGMGTLAIVPIRSISYFANLAQRTLDYSVETANRWIEFNDIAPEEFNQELREAVSEVRDKVYGMQNHFTVINARLQELDDAERAYRSLLAEGDRIQIERQVFRQRSAAVIQGFRTRDAGFRIFRNEKLERYKALFDLAAKYAFMAAQAYDFDTGLLHTDQGREFINRILRSRALGVVQDGTPQFAGSNAGDPGLSSVLAEMYGDWGVVKSRLGFNNPDAYGTTVSLRTENYRILPDSTNAGSVVQNGKWTDILIKARTKNLLEDADVRRYCMQIDSGDGLPVPGLILEFSTTIADGLNLFGKPLAPWDHAFSPSSFATKVYALGVALEGYQGMDDPATNDGAVAEAGGESPDDPNVAFLDPVALAATPYIYVIPVGEDSMRSPPLGDQSVIRTWNVQDVTIPLPFNIGGSDFSSKQFWQTADSLSEPLLNIRKHQAFRPVSTASVLTDSGIYSTGGEIQRNKYTSTRLIGRSAWNSKWKIVIPGRTLLNNSDEGLDRFIRSVHDIKLYFMTYSYSGN